MNRCKTWLIGATLALLASTALAQQTCEHSYACLAWTHDGLNTTGFKIKYGTSPETINREVVVSNPLWRSMNVGGLQAGETYHFLITAFGDGGESPPSNMVSKLITGPAVPKPPPVAPVLKVRDSQVYQVVGSVADQITLLPVGTVPPDTPCIPDQTVNGHYAVPRAAVTWYGNVQPKFVVARCAG
jgi:hypothetical protein